MQVAAGCLPFQACNSSLAVTRNIVHAMCKTMDINRHEYSRLNMQVTSQKTKSAERVHSAIVIHKNIPWSEMAVRPPMMVRFRHGKE